MAEYLARKSGLRENGPQFLPEVHIARTWSAWVLRLYKFRTAQHRRGQRVFTRSERMRFTEYYLYINQLPSDSDEPEMERHDDPNPEDLIPRQEFRETDHPDDP